MAGRGGKKNAAEDASAKKMELERGIGRAIKELDVQGATVKLGTLVDTWKLQERDASFEMQTIHMFRAFGLNYESNMVDDLDRDRGSFGLRELDDTINAHELEAIGLYHRMHELNMLPESNVEASEDQHLALRQIVKVLETVFYAKRVVLSAFQAKLAVHQLHVDDGVLDLAQDLDARLGSWALRFRFIDGETSAFQSLLLYLLDAVMEKKYRKYGDWLYEPIVIDGQDMHSWRSVVEIKEFVYSMLRKETCWDQWKNATHNMKNVSSSIEYLTNCHDHQLPWLVKQRAVYSFTNGVYLAAEERFHDFATAKTPLSDSIVSCKFVDRPFVPYDDWRDIPTPNLDSIPNYQGWTADVREWMYVFLGRLLYPLNAHDSWQVIPFFLGSASSGKCFCRDTPVMMRDGSSKPVQDIRVGDELMGDDSTSRRVLTLARGIDDMFDIVPANSKFQTYRVTREHVLCLKLSTWDSETIEMTVDDYMKNPDARLMAYRTTGDMYGFSVVPTGKEAYYGFETDGNHRFLLGDFTVTHNSTVVLKVCKNFYEALDVGILSNNIEKKFGISAFYDKNLVVAPEIRNDLAIEQAEFQSIVSGEDIQVNVKHKKAFSVEWTVPGVLAGNEVPNWADSAGSIQRRIVLFEFTKTVRNGDMKLGEKLNAELPNIIQKCNRAYLEKARAHSDVNVWTVLPSYFHRTRNALAQATNSVEAFLASTDLRLDAETFMPIKDFQDALKEFEIRNNLQPKRNARAAFNEPFEKFGLRIAQETKTYRGCTQCLEYIFGVDLARTHVDVGGLG